MEPGWRSERSAKDKDKDKKSDSDIEPTHSRKEWPELPPGVKAASVGAVGIRLVLSKVFHNERALKQYLRSHPKSDPSKHSVKGKPSGKDKKDKGQKEKAPPKKKELSDLSKQPGFGKLKGLSPEKQREVVQRALEMGKPKKDRKPVQRDMSDEYKALKGLSPADQRKVIERALKMAALDLAGYLEGDKVVVVEEERTPGGMLLPGMTATVTGVGSGPSHDKITVALDNFEEAISLTNHIPVSPKAVKKQACGCNCGCEGDCGCQGQCATASHHVKSFVRNNPDLSDLLDGVSRA
jgi:hypothetical protein